jgi:anti-sigma factor ChrR (cupin superfamily)
MNCTEQHELAALLALGVLEPSEAARIEAALAHDPDARAEVVAMKDAVTAFVRLELAQKTPSPALRERVLAQIARTPQLPRPAVPSPVPPARPGFHFVGPEEGVWMPTPIPGIRMKMLSVNRETGYWCVKAELAPGARYPHHEHRGAEDLYILSGDLHTEGRALGPGDFLHAEPGTDHGELHSPGGCVALLIEKAPDEVLAQLK